MDRPRPRYIGEAIKPVSAEAYDWHSHDFGQPISAVTGSMYVGTPDRVLLLSPAMLVWIPPDIEHWMRYGSKNEMLYVDVNREEAWRLGTDCRIMSMTPLLSSLLSATQLDPTNRRDSDHNEVFHNLLRCELIAATDVPLSIAMPRDRRVISFAQKAFENPGAINSIDSWFANAAASRKTIERLFCTETGMTPAQWLRHARILHGISQLAAGEKVSAVALNMGYESSSAFSYMFRRSLGVNPRDFCG